MLSLLSLAATADERPLTDRERQRITQTFPTVDQIGAPEGNHAVRTLRAGQAVVGYAYQTLDVVNIPAYSGKPVNLQVLLDAKGIIRDAFVLEHHEPILLVGIPEQRLHDFADAHKGLSADQRVVVGRSKAKDTVSVDAVAGATVTVMVVSDVIMRSAHKVAIELGLVEASAAARAPPAEVIESLFHPADWITLTGNGAIRRLHLTRGEVDDAFKGTPAEGVEQASADQRDDTLIDLYVAYLNAPTIGRNLLGETAFNRLMASLKPGEHAIAVMANGTYSFKGSGYVRGGIFDRVQVRQHGDILSFRDLDHARLSDVYAQGIPSFGEMAIFTLRAHAGFDPGAA
ncbi:MAG: FMN-binding protein, partial [Gammaproteobacteria bacterium]|nr:FMN-binding protein [Gammaproteobacteria bacterium]